MMLQRHWSMLGILYINFLLLSASDPVCKLKIIRHSCRQHHNTDGIRKLHNDFFPDRTALLIVNIMNFVKNDPFNVLDLAAVIVEHRLQNFGRHDQTRRVLV
jgi:hypothetical protein